ncbi:hypothetical protein J6590_082887 [Homalodisca vitripennis]|nr:hypothetical protein J6590_082887 [Homalodisca vitripennis]
MHYFYGYARGNVSGAARLYRQHVVYSGDPQPVTFPDQCTSMILRVQNAYLEGRVPGEEAGYLLEMRDPDIFDFVPEELVVDLRISDRRIQRDKRFLTPAQILPFAEPGKNTRNLLQGRLRKYSLKEELSGNSLTLKSSDNVRNRSSATVFGSLGLQGTYLGNYHLQD